MGNEALLRGVRVVDLTQNVAGPFCSQILGDLGAEVIKIERPGSGDDTRQWRPPQIAGQSATFLALNRNKRSLSVDIDTPEGQKIVRELSKTAQVFIHSLKPGSAEKRGLGHDDLKAINPKLIYSGLSAFGSTGPLAALPGYDPLMQAFTGVMSVTGAEGQEPVRVGVSLIDMGTGLWSAFGIVCALLRQKDTGEGALVETSLMETGVNWMTVFAAGYFATGNVPKRMGSAMSITAPYELFPTKDGHVFIAAGNDRLFRLVCGGLGKPELADDKRFTTNPDRVQNRPALHEAIAKLTATQTAADVVAKLRKVGAPCSELNNIADVMANEQVQASGIVTPLPLDIAPDHRVLGLPMRIDGSRGVTPTPPPAMGANTEEILNELGYSPADLAKLRGNGAVG
jgi:crotonobetainyl-CoA:carnitine CoA-transferase CaiB-like acyl-CoA transferase